MQQMPKGLITGNTWWVQNILLEILTYTFPVSQSSPLKLLEGGVPVPATPSQKLAAAYGLRTLTGLNTVVHPQGRPAQRFLGARRQEEVSLGSTQDIEASARVRQQPGAVDFLPLRESSLSQRERSEQGTLEIELHPEEQLGAFS